MEKSSIFVVLLYGAFFVTEHLHEDVDNMESIAIYIGIGAGICTSISLLPQLIKIIREKKADDISYWMLCILLVGLSGWIWYGIIKTDWPIIITNCFSVIVNLLIIIFSARYKD